MARRILGAVVILQALAPLILLSVFAFASVMTVRRISRAAGAYRDRVGAEVAAARETFATANQGFAALSNYFTGVKSAVDRVAGDVARFASTISVPLPSVPPIPIPGAAQFRRVVADTREFAGEARSAFVRWLVVVLGAVSFGLAVWLLGSLARVVVEVQRGWRMLWGLAPTAP